MFGEKRQASQVFGRSPIFKSRIPSISLLFLIISRILHGVQAPYFPLYLLLAKYSYLNFRFIGLYEQKM